MFLNEIKLDLLFEFIGFYKSSYEEEELLISSDLWVTYLEC